jgi:hypothetical protein
MQYNESAGNKSKTILTLGTYFLLIVLIFNGCAAIKAISTAAKGLSAVFKTVKVAKVLPPAVNTIKNVSRTQALKKLPQALNLADDIGRNEVPILMNLPGDLDEFKNIHNALPSQSQMSAVYKVDKKIYLNGSNVKKLESLQNLVEQVRDAQGQYVIIVGHNDEGRLIFVNGDSVELIELQNSISSYNKIPIFLSCRSQKYSNNIIGISNDITYDEAYETSKKLSAYLEENSANWKTLSQEEIAEKLKDLHFDYKLDIKIKKKVMFVSMLASSSREDNRDRKSRKLRR